MKPRCIYCNRRKRTRGYAHCAVCMHVEIDARCRALAAQVNERKRQLEREHEKAALGRIELRNDIGARQAFGETLVLQVMIRPDMARYDFGAESRNSMASVDSYAHMIGRDIADKVTRSLIEYMREGRLARA